jgi:hypothetical protein
MRTYYDLLIGLFAVLGIAFSTSVVAADATTKVPTTTKAEYKDALKHAQADYKAAYAACPPSAGPERLACRRQAYANLQKADGDAREAHGMPRQAQGPRE